MATFLLYYCMVPFPPETTGAGVRFLNSILIALPFAAALLLNGLMAVRGGWRGVLIGSPVGAALVVLAVWLAARAGAPNAMANLPIALAAYLELCVIIGVFAHIYARQRARLELLALTDDLTGIPNRRHARMYLERAFASAQRGAPLCVVLFDLDDFKSYNDRHGHERGDVALRTFARVLDAKTRVMDLSSRFGGDEFLSVISSSREGALSFARRVQAALQSSPVDGEVLQVSVGVAAYEPGMSDAAELLRRADTALYGAKANLLGKRDVEAGR